MQVCAAVRSSYTVYGQIFHTHTHTQIQSFSLDKAATLMSLVFPPRGACTWTDEKSEQEDTGGKVKKKVLSGMSEQIRGQMKEIQKTERRKGKERGGRAERKKEKKQKQRAKGTAEIFAPVKQVKITETYPSSVLIHV